MKLVRAKKIKLVIAVLIVIGLVFAALAVADKLLPRKIVQTNFTDPKTGAQLSIGENKLPNNFPEDFPIYENSQVVTSLDGNGFWLTLTTADTTEKVIEFYKTKLKENGWDVNETPNKSNESVWNVNKGKLNGYLMITSQNNLTTIIIVLGDKETLTQQ